jgi:rfaE bifunctional protein kinase chain/domain
MSKEADDTWLEQCLSRFPQARVAVLGDFAIDAYWLIDPDESELSVETGLPVRRVRQQRYNLGGAGNVVANLAALGVGKILAVGLVGEDIFGGLMLKMLQELGADTAFLLPIKDNWQTPVFSKPCVGQRELNRVDFGPFNTMSPSSIDAVAAALEKAAGKCDVVILNQQIPAGLSTPDMIKRINNIIAANGGCRFIVDSRDRAGLYRGAMLKVNSHEAGRLLGQPRPLDERIPADLARQYTRLLAERTGKTVFITRGENGMIVVDGALLHEAPGIQIVERTDPVGAGDTAIAAMVAVLASGGDAATAAELANIAASITVRKLQTTGTASLEEIRAVGPQPDYVYLPELAEDPRHARYFDGREIEIIRTLPSPLQIRHAIFDHDGTISTLRQGWEGIMEPMMVRAILGGHYGDADEGLYHKVIEHVRAFIDKTTGMQTLSQMVGLVDLVRQFGCVSSGEILDIHGYKALYNEKLLEMVSARLDKLRREEVTSEDFQIKGARKALEALHRRGVKLYLASGTDQADVESETKALGYAHLFEGRISGAVGDVTVETKKVVLERILREHKLGGFNLATFGDGPVEMCETRKRGGVAVGVASDEVRRFGLSSVKRTRLIRAGADLVIPDFTQLDSLLAALGLK